MKLTELALVLALSTALAQGPGYPTYADPKKPKTAEVARPAVKAPKRNAKTTHWRESRTQRPSTGLGQRSVYDPERPAPPAVSKVPLPGGASKVPAPGGDYPRHTP